MVTRSLPDCLKMPSTSNRSQESAAVHEGCNQGPPCVPPPCWGLGQGRKHGKSQEPTALLHLLLSRTPKLTAGPQSRKRCCLLAPCQLGGRGSHTDIEAQDTAVPSGMQGRLVSCCWAMKERDLPAEPGNPTSASCSSPPSSGVSQREVSPVSPAANPAILSSTLRKAPSEKSL